MWSQYRKGWAWCVGHPAPAGSGRFGPMLRALSHALAAPSDYRGFPGGGCAPWQPGAVPVPGSEHRGDRERAASASGRRGRRRGRTVAGSVRQVRGHRAFVRRRVHTRRSRVARASSDREAPDDERSGPDVAFRIRSFVVARRRVQRARSPHRTLGELLPPGDARRDPRHAAPRDRSRHRRSWPPARRVVEGEGARDRLQRRPLPPRVAHHPPVGRRLWLPAPLPAASPSPFAPQRHLRQVPESYPLAHQRGGRVLMVSSAALHPVLPVGVRHDGVRA